MKKGYLSLIGLFAVAVVIYAVVTFFKSGQDLPIYNKDADGKVVPLHSFEFEDENGRLFKSSYLEGKVYLVNFFFTTCTSICMEMNTNLKSVVDDFANTDGVEFVSFTVNPEYDTVSVLKKYSETADFENTKWHFLTGSKKVIYQLARNDYRVASLDISGGNNVDFIHSDKIILVDAKGNIRGYYSGTEIEEIHTLEKQIKKLLKTS